MNVSWAGGHEDRVNGEEDANVREDSASGEGENRGGRGGR
jgi:hypothetical protein